MSTNGHTSGGMNQGGNLVEQIEGSSLDWTLPATVPPQVDEIFELYQGRTILTPVRVMAVPHNPHNTCLLLLYSAYIRWIIMTSSKEFRTSVHKKKKFRTRNQDLGAD